jgi:hypothetical protein
MFLSTFKVGNSVFILLLLTSFLLFTDKLIYFKRICFVALLALLNIISIYKTSTYPSGDTLTFTNNLIIIILLIIISNTLSKTYSSVVFIKKTIKAILISAIITGIIGILQTIELLPNFESATGLGMMGHKNHYAYFIALAFNIALYLYLSEKKKKYLIIGIFLFIAVLFAMSRGALLCVVIGMISVFIYVYKMKLRHLLGFSVILVGFYYIVVNLYEKQLNQQDATSGRLELWAYFLPKSQDEFFFGKGIGSSFQVTSTDINKYGGFVSETNDFVYTHNDYLFLLHDYGIFIALSYLILVIINFRVIIINYSGVEKALFISLMLTFFTYQQIDTCFFGVHNFPIFFIVCLLPLHIKDVLKQEKKIRNLNKI